MRRRRSVPAVHGERGIIAGGEALAVGSLVLVAGMFLILNAWAVIDTRMALDSAAREYLRTYTEAEDSLAARTDAGSAALGVLADRNARIEHLTEVFGPCAPARVRITSELPVVRIPFTRARWGVHTVTVDAVELIDAHREMRPDAGYDPSATACHG